MKNKDLMDRIEINPDIMLGKPVIKGTRLPVSIIVEKIAYGTSIEEILKQYPFYLITNHTQSVNLNEWKIF